jgi:hypothetical protein
MISQEDCVALSGLSEEEVAAIAEHEHIPDIAAAALGNYLLHIEHGTERIREMIVDDIRIALDRAKFEHAQELFMALRQLLSDYPEAKRLPRRPRKT